MIILYIIPLNLSIILVLRLKKNDIKMLTRFMIYVIIIYRKRGDEYNHPQDDRPRISRTEKNSFGRTGSS